MERVEAPGGYAYAWRSGRLEFGAEVPQDALAVAQYADEDERGSIENYCRRGHEPDVLLVPGIPEARTEVDAFTALFDFRQLLQERLEL